MLFNALFSKGADRAAVRSRSVFTCLTLLAMLGSLPAASQAQTVTATWNSAQTGAQSWGVSGNWTGGIPGATSGSTSQDQATFGTTSAATTIAIDVSRNLKTLLFNGTNTAGLYTLGGEGPNAGPALRLSSGGNITMASGTLTTTTINAPLILEAPNATSSGSFTINNNATSADADPGTYKLNIAGNISGGTTTGSITLNLGGTIGNRSANDSGNNLTGLISNGGAAGGVAVTVSGLGGQRGAWRISNDGNSYTGNTSVTSGTLLFTSIANAGTPSALGAGSTLNFSGGSHVKYQGGAASTDRTVVVTSGGSSFYNFGSGVVTFTGPLQLTGGTLTFRGLQNVIWDGLVSGNGGLNRTDNTIVFLNNNGNTFTGNVSISDGAFRAATLGDKGVISALGAGSTITLGQNSNTTGRLEFNGPSGGSSNRDFIFSNGAGASSGNGRIDSLVAGQTLALSGTFKNSSSVITHVSSLNLNGAGNGVLSGVIGGTTADAAATIALELTKGGSGIWALSGANNYSRGTLVTAGTLLATNTIGSATGSGSVTTSGTATLGGTGFITGGAGSSITIASGTKLMIGNTHQVAAGATGAAGYVGAASNLRLGTNANVAITLAGTLQFDLFTNAGASTLGQADLLTLGTTASSITLGGTISVVDSTPVHSPWTAGRWQLIDWTGIGSATKTGTFTFDFTGAGALPTGYGWVTDTFYTDGVISVAKIAANRTWTGTTPSMVVGGVPVYSWANPNNWESGDTPESNTDSTTKDVFFFGNSTNSAQITEINGNKTFRNIYFSGEQNYTINVGTGGGVLYSAGTMFDVQGGSHLLNAQLRPTAGNIAAYTINNNGTLVFRSSIMYHRQGATTGSSMDLVFTGTGDTTVSHFQRRSNTYDLNIVKNGAGTLTLDGFTNVAALADGAGYITGTTTVNQGRLRLNDERNLGGDPAAFNAGQLTLNGGIVEAYASFTMDDANRGITFGANGGTFDVETGVTLTVANSITGVGSFTKAGDGRLTLSGTSTHTGTTSVIGGVLDVASTGFTGTGATTVSYGAQLSGTGTVQASSFTLLEGATLQAGNVTSGFDTGNGTLTFTPTGAGTFEISTNSNVLLSISSATNQSALDPTFGGNAVGSPGYAAYVASISGAGDHDRLVFNGATGSTLDFQGRLQVSATGFTPQLGQVFNLLDWSTLVSANFNGFDVGVNRDGSNDSESQFNLPDISGSGFMWDVSQFTSTGSIIVVLVPEPGRALLLLLGLLTLFGRRRR